MIAQLSRRVRRPCWTLCGKDSVIGKMVPISQKKIAVKAINRGHAEGQRHLARALKDWLIIRGYKPYSNTMLSGDGERKGSNAKH